MPYIGKSPSAGVRQRYQYTATAGQTTFSGTDLGNLTLTYTDNNFVDVFQNGVLLKGGGTDYTATSGTSVVLTTGASVSDVIEIIVYDVFSVGNFFNRTDSDSRYYKHSLGEELILDADGDTSITADTDDQVDIKMAGNDQVVIATGSTAFKAPDGGSRYALNGMGNSDSAELSLYDSSDAQKVRIGAGADTFFNYGKVGIGTTSPSTPLHVVGNNGILVDDSGNGDGQIYFGGISGSDRTYLARSSDDFLIWNVANGTMKFGTNNSERLRILAGGGITFNGDTATANALDDYEEGTIDISSLSYSNSGGATTHSGNQALNYTKVGRLVHINGNIHINDADASGSQSGWLQIPLPFAAPSGNTYRAVGQAGHYSHDESAVWLIEGGGSVATFRFAYLWDTPTISDNNTAVVNITYQVAT